MAAAVGGLSAIEPWRHVCVYQEVPTVIRMPSNLKIRRIDARTQDARKALAELRERLSPRGNIVSEAGRRRTIEVFGEPLTPQQVVERICNDVRQRGLAAVLDYSKRIDKAELTRRHDSRACCRAGAGTSRGRRRISGNNPTHPRQHPSIPARARAGRRDRASRTRQLFAAAGSYRLGASASASRAGRPHTLRPC